MSDIEMTEDAGKIKKAKKYKRYTKVSPAGERNPQKPESAHQSRDQEVAEDKTVHELEDEPWVNPASLPFIKPRPGYVQRWVRVAIKGEADPTNTARKWREGWRPRRAETLGNIPAPVLRSGEFSGCIGVEGMVLCEMPVERNARRNEHFRKQRELLNSSINEDLQRVSEHGSPAFGRIEKTEKTQRVRAVRAAGDE